MGEALLVNPNDEERTAVAIETALSMSTEERRLRMRELQEDVNSNDVFRWSEQFLTLLQDAAGSRGTSPSELPAPLPVESLADGLQGGAATQDPARL